MTEGIMTTDEFEESKQGWSGRKNTWIGLATIVVVIIIGVTVGVAVGGNNKADSISQPQSTSSSSLSDPNLASNDEDRLVASSPPSVLSPTDRPSEKRSAGPTFAATDNPSLSPPVALTNPPTLPPTTIVANTDSPAAGTIISGTTIGGMPYLRCSSESNGSDTASAAQKQVVLLHGSSFNKETWEEHDMLPQFCNGAEMVVALDFPISTSYQGLMQVLDDLRDADNETGRALITKPVTLVTPSASGFSVVSWIMGGDVTMLPSYIAEWVPVAPVSLVSASDEQIGAVKDIPGFAILAINGNEDQAGGKYSTRLADLAGATAVELVGRHAVYLQSPDEFVQTILDFVP
jgi:hypothetical protein